MAIHSEPPYGYPVQSNQEIIDSEAYGMVYGHWNEFYSTPKEQRLGDETSWDGVIVGSLEQLGLQPPAARSINECAKIEAQGLL